MKKFTQKEVGITKTPMADKFIDFDQVEKMRIAIYANNTSEKPYVAEVDFYFTSPQAAWENKTDLKLRNDLYKLNNIAYKVPSDFASAQPFYDMAVECARKFKRYTGSDLHNKLGKRYPDRYYTIPYTYISYDPVTKSGVLQITLPFINDKDEIDYTTNYQAIEFQLDKVGNGLEYTWLGEDA